MREIRFRAKRLENNEWVYGYYLYIEERQRHYILTGDIATYPVDIVHNHLTVQGFEWIEVDGKTVCEFIGSLYPNDSDDIIDVYEKDIVRVRLTQHDDIKLYRPKKSITCCILYDEDTGRFSGMGNFIKFSDWVYNDWEVVGNLFDNPELMEE